MELSEIKSLIDAMAAQGLETLHAERAGWRLVLTRTQATVGPALPPAPTVEDAAPDLRAPLAGVLHWRPAPDAPAFVAPGQAVHTGDVLCIIEAMKVFNQVRAERDGRVVALLAQGGDEVEAGQTLVRLA